MAQSAYPIDFSAPFNNPAEGALARFREPSAGPEEHLAQAMPVDDGSCEGYVLYKSAPEVAASEVERAGVDALEITVLWGGNVLHVSHLTPPRDFTVGEDGADFLLPASKLGGVTLPLVRVEQGSISLVLPAGAEGHLELSGRKLSLDQVREGAEAFAESPGACRVPLGAGTRANVRLGDFTFRVAVVTAGKEPQRGIGASWDRTIASYLAGAFLLHGALMTGLAAHVPSLGMVDEEGLDEERLYVMQAFLNSAAEREKQELARPDDGKATQDGGTGQRATGSEGEMGKPTAARAKNHYAIKGPKNNPEPTIAREVAIREARDFGLVGMLKTGIAGDPNSPTAPWGRDSALGRDDVNAIGNMWGDDIGEAYGQGGLGLTGVGEGSGGKGEGIGLGDVGTIGRSAGLGTNDGFGNGHGRLTRGHTSKGIGMRPGKTVLTGRLPPEVIQRVVRQNFGRFRLCYEQGLQRNPNLEGRVEARFVIGRDGAVSNVMNGASDLPDSAVKSCVLSSFYGLSFPSPEAGIVTVAYPIMLTPGS